MVKVQITSKAITYTDGDFAFKVKPLILGSGMAKEALSELYGNIFTFYFPGKQVEDFAEDDTLVVTKFKNGVNVVSKYLVYDVAMLALIKNRIIKLAKAKPDCIFIYRASSSFSCDEELEERNINDVDYSLITDCRDLSVLGFGLIQRSPEVTGNLITGLMPFHQSFSPIGEILVKNDYGRKVDFLIKTKSTKDIRSVASAISENSILSKILLLNTNSLKKKEIVVHCLLSIPSYFYVQYLGQLLSDYTKLPVRFKIN